MALSADQIFLLNTLTYISREKVYDAQPGDNVGDYVRNVLNNEQLIESISDPFMSPEQIRNACEQIASDPQLTSMTIASATRTPGGADRLIFVTADHSQAVVAMEGTMGAAEWYDDAVGGAPTDTFDGVSTPHQKADLDWQGFQH